MEGEGLVNLTWSAAQASHVVTLICYGEDVFGVLYYLRRWDKCRQRATSSIQNISELEGIAPKGCRMICVKYQQWQNLANVAKKWLLQTRVCSRGRSFGWNLSCFSSFSVARDIKCEHVLVSRTCDIMCADHVVRFTRPSPSGFCILQVIKNWSRGRLGNEAKWGHLQKCLS